jgi:SAM-dependent methyltransferase
MKRTRVPGLDDAAAARAARYDRVYAGISRDSLVHDLHRQALGEEYPAGIEVIGACTRGTLERALAGLSLRAGGLLVDLGCGLGGPGRWLARASGARVLGLDVSQVAVDAAGAAAREYLRAGQYEYRRGTFTATGLPDGCADGVVAIEALGMSPDRGTALAELRRILRPGGRATFTGGERHGLGETARRETAPRETAPGEAFRWAPLIAAAGLELVSTYVDASRSERWLAVCALRLEHAAELRDRLGELAEELIQDARDAPAAWGVPGLVGVQFVVERPAPGSRTAPPGQRREDTHAPAGRRP